MGKMTSGNNVEWEKMAVASSVDEGNNMADDVKLAGVHVNARLMVDYLDCKMISQRGTRRECDGNEITSCRGMVFV